MHGGGLLIHYEGGRWRKTGRCYKGGLDRVGEQQGAEQAIRGLDQARRVPQLY